MSSTADSPTTTANFWKSFLMQDPAASVDDTTAAEEERYIDAFMSMGAQSEEERERGDMTSSSNGGGDGGGGGDDGSNLLLSPNFSAMQSVPVVLARTPTDTVITEVLGAKRESDAMKDFMEMEKLQPTPRGTNNGRTAAAATAAAFTSATLGGGGGGGGGAAAAAHSASPMRFELNDFHSDSSIGNGHSRDTNEDGFGSSDVVDPPRTSPPLPTPTPPPEVDVIRAAEERASAMRKHDAAAVAGVPVSAAASSSSSSLSAAAAAAGDSSRLLRDAADVFGATQSLLDLRSDSGSSAERFAQKVHNFEEKQQELSALDASPSPLLSRQQQHRPLYESTSTVAASNLLDTLSPLPSPSASRIPPLPSQRQISDLSTATTSTAADAPTSNYHADWRLPDPAFAPTATSTVADAAAAVAAVAAAASTGSRPVHVVVRVRPFTDAERDGGARRVVAASGGKVVVVNPTAYEADPDDVLHAPAALQCKEWAQVFRVHDVLWSHDRTGDPRHGPYIGQADVHRKVGTGIVDHILNGFSAACFAYGHTGTGKTYTLFGKAAAAGGSNGSKSRSRDVSEPRDASTGEADEDAGLVPRLLRDVIHGLHGRYADSDDVRVTLSFVEMYNDKIVDLLASGPANGHGGSGGSGQGTLRVREHPVVGPYAEGASRFVVNGNVDKALQLVATGAARRNASASHGPVAHPSRAHAVVTLEISQGLDMLGTAASIAPHRRPPAGPGGRAAPAAVDLVSHRFDDVETDRHYVRLHCVDLAGSEKGPVPFLHPQQVPQPPPQPAAAATVAEARSIRRSLSTLGHVVRALSRGEPTKSLPYRDSTLTWLLRDALSDRNHTTVLVTLSPASGHHEESVHSLRYAERLCTAPPASRGSSAGNSRTRRTDSDPPPRAHAQPPAQPAVPREHDLGYGLGGRPGSAAARMLLQRAVADPQQRLARMGVHSPPSYPQQQHQAGQRQRQRQQQPRRPPVLHATLHARPPSAEMGGIERYYPTHAADEQFSEPSPTHVDYPHHQHHQHHEQLRQQFHAGPARPPSSPEGSPDDLRSAYRHLQGRLAETEIALETVKTDRDSLYIELRHAQDSNLQRAPRAASADRGGAAPAGPTGPAGPSDEVSALRALLDRREAEVAGLLEALAEERHARVALEEAADALARTEAAATGWPPAPAPVEPAGGASGDAALRARLQECEAQLADAHASIAVLLDDAHAKEDAGHDAGRRPDARAAAGAAGAGAGGDGGAEVVRLRREVEALGKDRDALAAIVDQQEIALKLQGQQAAAAEAAFEELREAQTRVTRGSAHAADELTRLQGALADVLSRESHLLRVETVDAERFVGVLAEVRRRLLEADSLHEEVAQERATNARLVQYLLASADVAARSPPAGSGRVTEADRLRHENAHLRRDLATTASEASRASGEHRRAKDALQTELARLWRHAQDVARRLAAQEAAVAEARAARDDAVRAGAAVEKRLHEVTKNYDELQAELRAIDQDLLEAVESVAAAPGNSRSFSESTVGGHHHHNRSFHHRSVNQSLNHSLNQSLNSVSHSFHAHMPRPGGASPRQRSWANGVVGPLVPVSALPSAPSPQSVKSGSTSKYYEDDGHGYYSR